MKISKLTDKNYKNNFKAFVWHAIFLALMKPFLDTDTIIPAMILKAGGNELLIGLATAILIGFAKVFQFFFGSFLSHRKQKKGHLLVAIFTRSTSILGLGLILLWFNLLDGTTALVLIFFFISLFSIAGAYGGVSYTDLIGKSIKKDDRKALFSIKNFAGALAFLGAAFAVKFILKNYEFPNNYAILYIAAFFLLSTATLGYVIMKEKITIPAPKKTLTQFAKAIPSELRKNPNLKYFLLLINTLGLSITAFPFLISYSKKMVGLTNEDVGNFLIMKVAGMVIFSLVVYYIRNKVNYKQLLVISVIIGTLIPILAILFVQNSLIYSLIFFLAGSLFSILSIAREGIVLEISNDKNRSEYAGIIGVGNIMTAILPLFSGFLIANLGYEGVFIGISIVVLSSLWFTLKLKCKVN